MTTRRHAMGIMSLAIIFVIAVGFGLAWTNYRANAGIVYNDIISKDTTESRTEIETVKRLAIPALAYASKDASLQVAASGGTLDGETIWYCDSTPTYPSILLILESMSNATLINFNKFLDDSTEINDILKLDVMPYTCSGIYPEKTETCPRTSYPETCDGWNVSATGGYIYDSSEDESHRHVQDIKATATEDRFFWMYYRLKEAEENTPILGEVRDIYVDQLDCQPGDPDCCITVGNLTAAFDSVMAGTPEFMGYFDEYVECEVEKECVQLHAISVKITCTDKKYKIPADDETGEKYLTWVLKEMITIGCDYEECIVIGPVGGGSSSGGGAPGAPAATMSGITSTATNTNIYDFAAESCSERMECFQRDRCLNEVNPKLCFDP